jgi:peroxiredoxin (alkyl hydroperoxide reductase subunit C)
MTCYPATVGRSIDEMIRMIAALQRVHAGDVLAPAGWTPGAGLLRPPGETVEAVLGASDAADWFYAAIPDEPAK